MSHPYLAGIAICAAVWALIHITSKRLRREMLIMSCLAAVFFPIHNIFYLKDYWHPDYFSSFRIEDFLLMFFIAGIAVSLCPVFFKKELAIKKNLPLAISIFLISVFLFIPFTYFMNSVYASFIGFLASILLGWYFVPKIIKSSVATGVYFFIFSIFAYVAFYYFFPAVATKWWYLGNLSGYFLLHFPIEEYIWDVLFAMSIYPVYKIANGKIYA